MGNLAVINIMGISPLSYRSFPGDGCALESCLKWAASVPQSMGTLILALEDQPLPGFLQPENRASWNIKSMQYAADHTEQALFDALEREIAVLQKDPENSPEALFYAWGDSPMLDPELTRTLWKLHHSYDAQYTFADGYPYGLAPEILSADMPGKLRPLAQGRQGTPARDTIFEVLRRDINAFDVETHLSPLDLRMDRVSLTSDSLRNMAVMRRLRKEGGTDAASLMDLIPRRRDLLRDRPAYISLQVTNKRLQMPLYHPAPFETSAQPTQMMDAARFDTLCRSLVDFTGDAVFNFALHGEPAAHPRIEELIRSALKSGERPYPDEIALTGDPADVLHQGASLPGMTSVRSRVLIETSGLGWDPDMLARLASEYAEDGRLMWIITLDALDASLYEKIRGEGRQEAETCARLLSRLFGANCWVQATRMNENEENLEAFYRHWQGEGLQVIIQKYNSCAGLMPNRQPADLSPLDRIPCRHLQRDLCILADGTVPVCESACGRMPALGNAFKDPPSAIWYAGRPLFERHVQTDYPKICGNCDEYYTFNF